MNWARSSMRLSGRLVAALATGLLVSILVAPEAGATIADKRNDYNVDGISDVVAINFQNDCLYRWNGNGSGGLGSGVQVGCGWGPYLGSLAAVGDVTGDGRADLAAIGDDGCLRRWTGASVGFGSAVNLGCTWGLYDNAIAGAGDLNGDGLGDLVGVNGGNGCLYRWWGASGGVFVSGTQVGCGWGNYAGKITGAGDLNRDGNADLVAINGNDDCLYRWYGVGNGTFGSGVQVGCGWASFSGFGQLAGLGDLDGDGNGDLVAVNITNGSLYRWSGNGSGSFHSAVAIGSGWLPYFLAT
jgi:FG-GAP-like repeat